jgi:hypothetical protein
LPCSADPLRRAVRGVAVIRIALTPGHEYTLAAVARDARAPRFEIVHYDRLIRARRLSRATTVFADLDRLGVFELELASAVAERLAEAGVRVLNHPARFKTRQGLLRALRAAGINDFDAYRLDEGARPTRYPVFLRRDAGHGFPLSGLLEDWDAVRRAADAAIAGGVPESRIIVVEYCGEPVRPGIFRKLAVARFGDRYAPQLCGHDETWLVKYGRQGHATPELYEEDLAIVRENRFAAPLARAFEIANVDYGRADFGIVGGRIQVYEINTNPHLRPLGPHPVAVRNESQRLVWERAIEALRELDAGRPCGPPVAIEDPRLTRHQGWRARRVRSRPVP